MLSRYLALILEYLIAKVGLHVMDWSLRQVVAFFESNPSVDRSCAEQSIERYMSEHDPDRDGFLWEQRH